ncbi:hypothetical protein LTR62_007779 [Meristemomyces frigidus]|uniref:BTB domain-containing protein n=1 Tax=Meristemomyces frigidus TaxID=1508187 RepID=A0AAN7YD67_9PEZI|nr:hypothetical protein LTR62_007779 [Meristemomyces frigidus]
MDFIRATSPERVVALIDSGKYSDLFIECKGRSFKVHKAFVCSQSEVLARECDPGMVEGKTGVIKHDEFDADTVCRMLSYMYLGKYSVGKSGTVMRTTVHTVRDAYGDAQAMLKFQDEKVDEGDDCTAASDDKSTGTFEAGSSALQTITFATDLNECLIAHTHVWRIADYYDIPKLRKLAEEKFEQDATNYPMVTTRFIDVVEEVHKCPKSEHCGLHGKLREAAMKNIDKLVQDDDFMSELAHSKDARGFAAEMLRAMVIHYNDKVAELGTVADTNAAALATAQSEIQELKKLVRKRETEVASNAQDADRAWEKAKRIVEDVQTSIKCLPVECRNVKCEKKFDAVYFVGKGQPERNGLFSDWWIKCERCSCRLNK